MSLVSRRAHHLATALALLAAALGGNDAAPAATRSLPKVATLVPCVYDGLRSTSAGPAVVAAARRFSFEPTPAGVADLGITHSPDFERLAASGAELVVADRRWHALAAERARALGADIFWFEADGVESTLRDFSRLGERLQIEAEIGRAVAQVRAELAQSRFTGSPRLLAVFGAPGSYLVITHRTWIGDLARTMGATLVEPSGADQLPGYIALSEEFLAGARVDAVLLLAHGEPAGIEKAFAADWQRLRGPGTSAVPLVRLDPQLFAINPGLRLPEAARRLAQAVDARR